jgi:RHS repeat-associated protein
MNIAFDDVNVVVGQENNEWGGALRIVVGSGAFAGGYDANGNMIVRVVDGMGQVLTYDAENRLVQVQTSTTTATFAYDGDGKRVKATIGASSTYYLGNYFEWTSGAMKKYYYAGGERVAMRSGASVYYLLTDHLGGTNVTITTAGAEYGELRYEAWGETYFSSGTTPTTMHFTGQREEQSLGIYFYNARYYDPMLGRFLQADSIIPNPADPPSFDRYAYVRNSPLNYTDPSGNASCKDMPWECDAAGNWQVGDDIPPMQPPDIGEGRWEQLGRYSISNYYLAHWSDFSGSWMCVPTINGGCLSVKGYTVYVPGNMLTGFTGVGMSGTAFGRTCPGASCIGVDVAFHCDNCGTSEVW